MAFTTQKPIAVLGAGSWGCALAIHLARNQQAVRLWVYETDQFKNMQQTGTNEMYLPGIALPENLAFFNDLATTIKDIDDILMVVPSHVFRETLIALKPYRNTHTRIVWATKGLDSQRHQLLHEVVKEQLGELPMAVLSGPTFAKEVAQGVQTAIALASTSPAFADNLMDRFHSKCFRVYRGTDIIGLELGGAMKNVIAIAIGLADGVGYGTNARCALITRGLAEMTRLGVAIGAQAETFVGLAGLGDLVLTCTDNQSRNRRFGLAIGSGNNVQDAIKQIGQVVEGFGTAVEIYRLATKHNVDIPICTAIYRILQEDAPARETIENLLTGDPKVEH